MSREEASRSLAIWRRNPARIDKEHAYAASSLWGADAILTVQPLHDSIGDFICLLRNLSQAVYDCQFKSATNIVSINQLFLSEVELRIESPMAFIDLKNHPCMLNLFIEQGNRVQAHKAVDEIRCHHL